MPSAGRILIADDEPMFLETTAELLGYRDYQCDCAQDAAEAADLLSRNRYDLLISDIRMPGNPRLELIRVLHEIAPGMPTILVTGNPSVDTAVDAIGLPVLAYMLKPVDFDELLGRVDQCMRKSRVAHRARDAKAGLARWRRDLTETAALIHEVDDPDSPASLDAFVTLGLKNVADVLQSFSRLAEDQPAGHSPRDTWSRIASAQLDAAHDALIETIEVLKRTKDLFKSKQLARLRHKIESLIDNWPKRPSDLP